MATALLLYATNHGHTAKIVGRLAEALRATGVEVELHDIKRVDEANPSSYDGVMAGASLHAGHHQRPMVDWVKSHRQDLQARPNAFFSVSLMAADDSDEARAATQKCIDDFEDETGWTPNSTVAIAGALQYREYDVFTRVLVRLKMKHDGHPTDTSQDHEYTDWAAVQRFGKDFAAQLER